MASNEMDTASPKTCQPKEELSRDPLPSAEPATEAEVTKKPLSFYFSFLALNLMVFIISLDATALNIAIPKITNDLHGTTLEAFWTNLSFILALVITQPIYTNVSDVLGRKIPLNIAFLLFFVGSIVFAVANTMPVLLGGRILQGLGGGGLDVLAEVILADLTTLKERPLYLGLFALPMAGGGICGPVIGAALSEFVHWRWIGWINLPISAVGFGLNFFFLRLRPIDQSFRSKLRRLDWMGMLLFAVGSTTFSLPLSWAGSMYPWSSWRTIVPLIFGAIIIVSFGIYEARPVEPIFPYRLFQNITAVTTIIGATIHGIILYSIMLYAPLFFQAVMLQAPFKSAISVLPASVSIIVFSIFSAIAVEVLRRYRWVVISSWVFSAVGIGIGVGTHFTVLTIPMQASLARVDDMGLAAGIIVCFRLFGALIGLAICASVFNNIFEQQIQPLRPLPPSIAVLEDAREAIGFIPALRLVALEPVRLEQITEVYRSSLKAVFLTLSGFGVVGFLTSLFTKELTLESEELGRQQLERPSTQAVSPLASNRVK
ncbi:hypothetical protein GJ744_009714 [Endocarpon pusillum]|uniref:Major facilitator superfamily (MFS) profile domain-containing protein n=1 Tax=Endocarpon pusillum TaxID=364733 RepID=A0A8H7AQ69_9EURO|nr:hypothetical protein GJ744_009714 [Endocarpon pusillum]